MKGNELISILIPTYNSESRLVLCFESVIAQTYKNIEIIVCDGGSTDRTNDILNFYLKKDKRFKFLKSNICNRCYQRNLLLKNCKGSYIFMLDSDDTISKNCISNLYKLIKRGFDVAMPQIILCDFNNKRYGTYNNINKTIKLSINKENVFNYLINANIIGCTKLYKKSLISNLKYDEKLIFGDDVCFNLELSLFKSYKYCYTTSAKYYYFRPLNKTIDYKYLDDAYIFLDKLMVLSQSNNDKSIKNSLNSLFAYYLQIFLLRFYYRKKIPPMKYIKYRFYALIKCKNLKIKQAIIFICPLAFLAFKFGKKFLKKSYRILK